MGLNSDKTKKKNIILTARFPLEYIYMDIRTRNKQMQNII